MTNPPKTIIIIDGSNFYFKLKSLGKANHLHFDFSGFAKYLAGKKKIISSTYYVGKVKTDRTQKAQKLHKNQQRLLSQLKKHNFTYKLG